MTELERYKKATEYVIERLKVSANSTVTTPPMYAAATIDQINVILNPPPVYEDVTVTAWMFTDSGGKIYGPYAYEPEPVAGRENIKLTGTRRVQVAQKVERSVSVEAASDTKGDFFYTFCDHPETFGKTGTLTFKWEE